MNCSCDKEGHRPDHSAAYDNSGICSRIGRIAESAPHEALELIDSALSTGAISPFRARTFQAKIYFNPLQEDEKVMECAREALSMGTKELTERERIILLRLLGNSLYLTGNYEESIRTAIEGNKAAEGIDSLGAQAEFRFLMGECMLQLGQAAAGYANMEYGVTALSKAKDLHSRSTLSHFLGEEMNFMILDGRIQDAIATGHRREVLLEDIRDEFGSSSFIDQQFGYLYGKMAYLYSEEGEGIKADEYARKFFGTDYSRDDIGKLRIVEYLIGSGQARKALETIGDTDFPSPGDSISNDGEYYLRQKALAWAELGDYRKAYDFMGRSYAISDSLGKRVDLEKAIKAFTSYTNHEAELKASHAETMQARYHLLIILILAASTILALGFFHYYNKSRNLVERNRLISMGRSDTEKYVRLLQSAQARIRELSPKEDIKEKTSEADSWQLFLKLEDAMENQKMFLDKGITRADILDLLGISKNRLGKMFQDIGGDLTLPSYINGKRLNHALGVIADHPEYSVNEIADASGFSNTRNFHLLFKKRFGITPLQYRDGRKKGQGQTFPVQETNHPSQNEELS